MNIVLALVGGGLMTLGRTQVGQASADPKGFRRPAHVRPTAPRTTPGTSPLAAAKQSPTDETIKIRRPEKPSSATVTIATGGEYRLEFTNNKKIVLTGQPEYFVGRADPTSNWSPAANLGPLGGEKQGVSRQHARLFVQGVIPYLEDLESHNGTFVNDQRLPPNKPIALKDKDRVRFGALSATFFVGQ